MICGLEFSNISKWSCCPRYPIRFKSSEIAENDMIFLNLDCFQRFMDTLYAYPPKHKFILITHNSDLAFTQAHLDKLRTYVNRIYSINPNFIDPIIFPIPIGFVDDKSIKHDWFKEVRAQQNQKGILIYMNFNVRTNVQKRTQCYNTFVNKPWVTTRANLPTKQFYDELSKSKYTLSPEGTGIDCHRIYESMFLDTIPILKTSQLDHFYKKLPIVIVQDWNEITEQFLTDNYDTLLKQLIDWKTENPTWTDATFWVNDFYE
jgi:hypothetical protein